MLGFNVLNLEMRFLMYEYWWVILDLNFRSLLIYVMKFFIREYMFLLGVID